MNRRVVFDTSTLVGAALRTDSVPHRALAEALGRWDLCVSAETLDELDRVLNYRKFDHYSPPTERSQFAAVIRRHAQHFQVPSKLAVRPPCRDPLDNKFLALAVVAEAAVIVSSDEDLLVLHPWNELPILRPGEFLARYSAQ